MVLRTFGSVRGLPALSFLGAGAGALALLAGGCGPEPVESETVRVEGQPLQAYCTAKVNGVGNVDVETDYLPHVVQCENGGAPFEALKAQAVAARTYLYYKLETSGSINDGTSDQVFSCGKTPNADQVKAVKETSGQFLSYKGTTICAFYVAGATQSPPGCQGNTNASTEKYVTYNWGLSGDQVHQTTLGWVSPTNKRNRGCQSQNGTSCLSNAGRPYTDMFKFYYGMDITLETATGPCVGGSGGAGGSGGSAGTGGNAGTAGTAGSAGKGGTGGSGGTGGKGGTAGSGGTGGTAGAGGSDASKPLDSGGGGSDSAAGPDSGGGGWPSPAGNAGSGAPGSMFVSGEQPDDGCSCRTRRAASGAGWTAIAVVAAAATLGRRRRLR
jgi:hypothetical protein